MSRGWLACRRVLNTPDFQLLVRGEESCDCGSGEMRAKCCFTEARPEEGGVLWPHFHLCTCDNEYDEFDNPKVSPPCRVDTFAQTNVSGFTS